MAVIAHAPARIDLAGGTLDIWPLYLMHPGAVTINVAVTIRARAEVAPRASGFAITSRDRGVSVEAGEAAELEAREPRLGLAARLVAAILPDRPVALSLEAAAPAHAGLGGSSTLAVAAAAALDRAADGGRDREALLRLVQDVETSLLQVPTGQQDYVSALWGGLQALHWEPGGLRRERLDPATLAGRLVLAYTGAPRFSGANNWEVTRRRIDGDAGVRARLDAIRDAARALLDALRRGDAGAAATAIDAEWAERQSLTPGIRTPDIDALEAAARGAGAAAFKVCGAGGGGCVVAVAPPARRAAVAAAMAERSGRILDFDFDETGLAFEAGSDGSPGP